jgi:hypothetical protein
MGAVKKKKAKSKGASKKSGQSKESRLREN